MKDLLQQEKQSNVGGDWFMDDKKTKNTSKRINIKKPVDLSYDLRRRQIYTELLRFRNDLM